jgi:hypothetical protein
MMIGSARQFTLLSRFGLRIRPGEFECTKDTDMREHVLLFCLLGLVLTATIILVTAPGTVTWALSVIE